MSVYTSLVIDELETLMETIDNNPLHPANDARHEDALRARQKTYF